MGGRMNVIVAAVLLTGGESATIVDRILPETVVLRIRMSTLRNGMSDDEVRRLLGLTNRLASSYRGTISHCRVTFSIGETHELTLDYSLKKGEGLVHGFTKATLT